MKHEPAGCDRWGRLLNITNSTYSSSSSGSLPTPGLESVDQVVRQCHMVASDRYGFFRHLQITIIGRFRFADISANADNLQIHIFIGRCGNISADLRGYLQIFEDIWMLWTVVSIWADILPNHSVASGLREVQIYLQIWGPYRQIKQLSADQLWICRYADTGLFCRYHIFRYIGMDICRFYLQIKILVAR